MLNDFYKQFQHLNYKPNHSEVYKGLHELLDDGMITSSRIIKEGSKRKELKVNEIANKEEARRYKKQVKEDLDCSTGLLNKSVRDNYD
jgi:DNA-binding PadR family transcriptional regulator